MTEDTIDRVEASLEKPDEELVEELPDLLDEMEGQVRELIEDHPTLFGRIIDRAESMDIAGVVRENPEIADQYQELLWTGAEIFVENNEELRGKITQEITVNFEANDCPMSGHLRVDPDTQLLTGGAGHLDEPSLTIKGPANVLVGLVTGEIEPIPGFMSGEYQMDGSIQHGTQLAPLITDLSNSIPG